MPQLMTSQSILRRKDGLERRSCLARRLRRACRPWRWCGDDVGAYYFGPGGTSSYM